MQQVCEKKTCVTSFAKHSRGRDAAASLKRSETDAEANGATLMLYLHVYAYKYLLDDVGIIHTTLYSSSTWIPYFAREV